MPASQTRDRLLFRFSLYGFLKNQQYYEPFFLLVLKSKGLTFFEIGLLYSFREVCVNVMGVPAGFLADMYGRRSSLVLCFVAYIVSFLGFAFTQSLPLLFVTMFAFAVGESFRSGTHKAMVFHHLRLTNRESEKAAVYGFTRSWSKTGSALSSLLSGLLVFVTGSYSQIFLFSIPPYLLNTVNVATYPKVLEGEGPHTSRSVRQTISTMWLETVACMKNANLRGLFVESATLQTVAKTVKDYVQPLVVTALGGLAANGLLSRFDSAKSSALLLGVLYFVLNTVAAAAARNAHRFDTLDSRPFPWLWSAVVLVGGLLTLGNVTRGVLPFATAIAVIGFVLLVLLENLWRPLFLDRLDDVSDSRYGAAVLSVEAQFSSLGVMICAPLVGKTADRFGLTGIGLLVCALGLVTGALSFNRKRHARAVTPASQNAHRDA
jgi:MFS family permease